MELEKKILNEYKKRFASNLMPFTKMLDEKKPGLSNSEWSKAVVNLKTAILRNPSQFLSGKIPTGLLLEQVIDAVFNEALDTDEVSSNRKNGS